MRTKNETKVSHTESVVDVSCLIGKPEVATISLSHLTRFFVGVREEA